MAVVGSPLLPSQSQRWLTGLLLVLLVSGCAVVLWPFATAIIWAVVLAYVTWTPYRHLRRWFGRARTSAAVLMTAAVSAVVIVPLLWLIILVRAELLGVFPAVAAWFSRTPATLPAAIRGIPGVGPQLSAALTSVLTGITAAALTDWIQRLSGPVMSLLGGVSRNLGKLVVALVMLYFLYRDGERIVLQCGRVMRHLGWRRLRPYLDAAGAMTRAVLYGFLVTALAQGLIAGVGYRIAGIGASVLLGALTAVLSILPLFGTALVWFPVACWMLAAGHVWPGLFVLAWGAFVIHPIDNLLHPLLISSAARAPVPVVFLGVIGGLAAFGLAGIVVGPVLLGLALVLWRQWDGEDAADAPEPHR